jgi:signal transduction histidine kinase
MKLKGRVGAILVLVLVFIATVGLFYYALQFRKDSVKTLQAKLQDMELQRLEDEKGKQTAESALKTAERFDQYVGQIQKRAETLADSGTLRQPHDRAALRKAKERDFLQILRSDSTWTVAEVTDEAGLLIAATNRALAADLSQTPEFREVSRQRMTSLRLVERKGRDLALQITVPCLGNTGNFLGALQVEVAFTPSVLDRIFVQGRLLTLLGTNSGRRLTPITLENFPNNLGTFVNKDLQQMESFLTHPGGSFFRIDWNTLHYLVGSAETRIPGVRVFTLLEVGGLEKLVGGESVSDNLLADPVVLGGLSLILLAGLLLVFWLSGESGAPARLNRELGDLLQDESAPLQPLTGPGGTEWQKLTASINLLIERAAGRPVIRAAEDPDLQATARWQSELDELSRARDQLAAINREQQRQVESLSLQLQELQATSQAPQAPVVPAAEASSQLRIDAIVNMSDDLKATLTVIKNYISSILSSEEGKITDAQQEFLGVVINKSARLERQINDLLDLSHLESEAGQMFMVPTDMAAMVQDVVLNSQPQADTKQIRLIQDLPASLSKVMLNGDRLGQVLITLVQHALRVSPVGGEVRIEVREGGPNQTIRISDGGTPLTTEQAEMMFTRFHGLDSSGGSTLAGSGLRFAIVREIVEAHRGSIVVHGLSGGGNEALIILPLEDNASAPAAAPTRSADNESFFDLSTFMQETQEAGASSMAGGGPDLDELLKNIEEPNEPRDV